MSTDTKKVEPKQVVKKVLKIVSDVAVVLFVIFAVLGLVFTLVQKLNGEDEAVTIFGLQMRTVLTNSMEKCEVTDVSGYEIKDLPVGSMVFINTVPEDPAAAEAWYASIKKGDVLTFRYRYGSKDPIVITHRVTLITKNPGGGYRIELEADNKNSDQDALTQVIKDTSDMTSFDYVIGKVVGHSRLIGFLGEPAGIVCIVILPAALVALWELFKIINIVRSGNKEKKAEQQSEMEELRRKLAMLEAAQLGGAAAPAATEASAGTSDGDPPAGEPTDQNNSVTNGEEP